MPEVVETCSFSAYVTLAHCHIVSLTLDKHRIGLEFYQLATVRHINGAGFEQRMASGLRSTRTQYRTVGVTSLRPAFGTSGGASRPDWSLASRSTTAASSEPVRSNAVEGARDEKPSKSKKSPSESGRKRKEKRHLRERRHGTGVVFI